MSHETRQQVGNALKLVLLTVLLLLFAVHAVSFL